MELRRAQAENGSFKSEVYFYATVAMAVSFQLLGRRIEETVKRSKRKNPKT